MADDIQSNIRINIDTATAMDSIRLLQNQISAFHTQMAKMGAASAADARNLQQNLINSINSTGAFTANMTRVRTTAEQFTHSLEKNKLTMSEYFRYAGGASKTFGRLFTSEFETINKVARERVKDLQSQYIKLGRDANGAMQAIRVRPLALDMDSLATKTQIAAQRQQLLNQLLKQGSTNLLNFGKNTQWAGRQLMVGFTIPLSIMGGAAMKAYQQIEEASIKLKRVYGDMNTTATETNKMVEQVKQLALEYTKYGVAVKDSMDMAATAAATGKRGADLLAQVNSATKLAVLGGVDQQKALQTTISLTNAFNISSKDLAKNINFLNAVENQTVLNIEDMTTAIPKAAPVIQQLGGDVKDLAFFLTAMKEGGINASEGANAIKSGLASLINPTNTASKMLAGFGINIKGIIEKDKGDLKKTVVDFASALDRLDPLNRARAIEQLFGKFQFARMSTLFKNVIAQGSQASEVLRLAGQSSLELSMMSQRELNKIQESPLYKFQKAIADFQAQLAPVGEQFMKAITPIINFGTDVLKQFNGLGDGVKQFIVKFVSVAGVVGPVLLMSFGLIANAVANVIKGFALVKDIFNKTGKSSLSLGEQVNYMTQEQIQAAAIASSLDQVHSKLKQTFTSEAAAVDMLTAAYERSVAAQRGFNVPITPRGPIRKYATGGMVFGPGGPKDDLIPAMLSNGEAVIDAETTRKNPTIIQALFGGKKIQLPHYANNNSEQFGPFVPPSNASQAVQNKIKMMQDAVSNGTLKIERSSEVMARTMASLESDVKVTFKEFIRALVINTEELTGANIGNQVNRTYQKVFNKRPNDYLVRYSATGVGTVEQQLSNAGRLDELRRAQTRLEAEKKISQQMGLSGQLQIDRAHRVDIGSSSNKLFSEAWRAETFNPQTHSENAISNALTPGLGTAVTGFKDIYTQKLKKLLDQGLIKQEEYNSILQKINKNVALSETELATQGVVLKKITQEDKEFLLKNKALSANILRAVAGSQVAGGLSTVPGVGTATKAAEQAAIAEINAVRQGVLTGVRTSTRQASPAKEAIVAGENIGEGGIIGMRSTVAQAEAAGKQVGSAVATGARRAISEGPWITPGQSQSQQVAVANRRNRRVATQGESYTPGNMIVVNPNDIAAIEESVVENTNANKQKIFSDKSALGRAANKSFDKTMGMKNFQGKMFGTSMGLGMASMFLPGDIGQMAGIASMVTSFAGMFKGLQPVVALVKGGFIKLIPWIGAAVVAYETWDKIALPLIRKNADAYNAITDTLNITQDKLTKINNFFGTDIKLTGIRASEITASNQTGEQASAAKQFQQSEEFKTLYHDTAQKLKNLTTSEFNTAMQFMATDLFGQGMEKEQVQAITDAIALDINKNKVSIIPELLSLDNPQTRGLMKNNIKNVMSNVSKNVQELQAQSGWGKYNVSQSQILKDVGAGEFDNPLTKPMFADSETVAKTKAGISEISSYLSALSGQYDNGTISAKTFNIEYKNLIQQAQKMPNTQGVELLNAAIAALGPAAAQAAAAIAALTGPQQSIVFEAMLKGINPTQGQLDILQYATGKQFEDQLQMFKDASTRADKLQGQIDKKKKQMAGIQNQTQDINNLEGKINDKYDKRIAQIEKIKKLNEQIAKSQEGQLTLAEALNRGDIAAAAKAAIDIQNNDIQASLDNQKAGLEDARKAELKPLQDNQAALSNSIDDLSTSIAGLTDKLTKNTTAETSGTPPTITKSPQGNDPLGWFMWGLKAMFDIGPEDYGLMPGATKVTPGKPAVVKPATGGHITGPGTGTSDSIPAMLSNGEYVIRANAVKTIGVGTLDKLNQADRLGFASGGMVRHFKGGGYNGYADGGRVKASGAPNPFIDPMGWIQGLVNGMYAGGGNPSAYLDNTAAKGIKTGAKSTLGFYRDYLFDPTDPVDYAFAAVPGALRQAGKQVAKGASKFGFPLVLQTPKKNLGITKKILENSGEGITPGGFRTIDGAEYYVKRPETAAETTGELINSTIWSQLGLGGPKLQMLTGRVLASKIIPDLIKTDRYSLADYIQKSPNKVQAANGLASGLRKYIDEALPTNALLGNWDTHSGNILFNPKTKKFENIDLGITALTTEGRGPVSDLFDNELAYRTRHLVNAMKKSGFNLFQINNILKKNGLSKVSKKALEHSDWGDSLFKTDNLKNLKQEKNLTPQINKIANMLGFNLKKTSSDKVNRAAMNAKTNPFIMDMIKTNPELAQWMKLSPATGSVDGGSLSDGLVSLFFRLKNASMNDSVVKFAKGGLVGYKNGGKAHPGAWSTSYLTQEQKDKQERTKLYRKGGYQGFEAGFNSWVQDLMGNPVVGGTLKGIGDYLEHDKVTNFALSSLSLPMNIIGSGVNSVMDTIANAQKGKWQDALLSATGIPRLGDAFASSYGHIFDPSHQYKSQFEVAAQTVIDNKWFGTADSNQAALARIIGGSLNVAADPTVYLGAGLATKAAGAASLASKAGRSAVSAGTKVKDAVKTAVAIKSAKNALKAAGTWADNFYEPGVGMVGGTQGIAEKVGNLTPRLGFNLSDDALQSMIKENFYGNMRTGTRSSTSDSLVNRIAVEKSMMGIAEDAPASMTPAYGFLTTKENMLMTEGSIWNRGAQTSSQQAINNFNQLINPYSRYLQRYGSNTIKLKPNTLGKATISMGDSLSIWDKALGLGQKIPKVNKLSSLASSYPRLHGILESTRNMMRTDIPNIKSAANFPYIEAHLPGGFTVKDIESIILHPTERFGPHATEKIAADLAERKAALEALFDSLGIKNIDIKVNSGRQFIDSMLPVKSSKSLIPKLFSNKFKNTFGTIENSGKDWAKNIKDVMFTKYGGAKSSYSSAGDVMHPKYIEAKNKFGLSIEDKPIIVGKVGGNPSTILEATQAILPQLKQKLANLEAQEALLPLVEKYAYQWAEHIQAHPKWSEWSQNGVHTSYLNNFAARIDLNTIEESVAVSRLMQQKTKNAIIAAEDYLNGKGLSSGSIQKFIDNYIIKKNIKGAKEFEKRKFDFSSEKTIKLIDAIQKINPRLAATLFHSTSRHRTPDAIDLQNLLHPETVPVRVGRVYGPGLYLAQSGKASEELFGSFGDNVYKIRANPLKTLKSKGYISPEKMAEKYSEFFSKDSSSILAHNSITGNQWRGHDAGLGGMPWRHEFIQKLINEGYLGYKHGDALTNWLVGVPKSGFSLIPAQKRSLFDILTQRIGKEKSPFGPSMFDFQEKIIKTKKVKPYVPSRKEQKLTKQIEEYNRKLREENPDSIWNFANGGMVRGYASGGFVLPTPEPAPTQYANGGMVKAAIGGMLINGKFFGGFSRGGMVPSYLAQGGFAMGTDTVPAMLTPGEFVIKKSAVDRIGSSTLAKINGYADGGLVGGTSAVSGDSVYNNTYEINVNVSSTSNPNDIANAVMRQIKQIDNGRVRGLNR